MDADPEETVRLVDVEGSSLSNDLYSEFADFRLHLEGQLAGVFEDSSVTTGCRKRSSVGHSTRLPPGQRNGDVCSALRGALDGVHNSMHTEFNRAPNAGSNRTCHRN